MVKLLVLNLSLQADVQQVAEDEVLGARLVDNVDVTVSSVMEPKIIDDLSAYDAVILNVDPEDAQESLQTLLDEADNSLFEGCLVGKLAAVHISMSQEGQPAHMVEALKDELWNSLTQHGMLVVPVPGHEQQEGYALRQGQYLANMASWLG